MRLLTPELTDLESPVREFLDRRFTADLPEVQRRYRAGARTDPELLARMCIFNARYAYLSTWRVDQLLDELGGCPICLSDARKVLRSLLPDRWADDTGPSYYISRVVSCAFARMKLNASLRKLLSC
jgi:hypothetical protein